VNFPPNQGKIGAVFTVEVVTAVPPVHSIRYVPSRMLLTKRRAVDFCRVATAMCPRPAFFLA
jgi:hypothetical protein